MSPPTELEELVDFLHHGNTQIRQIAAENLVQYSKTQPSIFKTGQLAPIKDLKLLVKDYAPIAKNALTILINISTDPEILKSLAEDDAFLETIMVRITNPKEPTTELLSMLLANLSKSDALSRLHTLRRPAVPTLPATATTALDQLLALFNAGVHGNYNPTAKLHHLAYVFADLAKFPLISTHLTTTTTPTQPPLTLLLPHLSPPAPPPLRLATASTTRNALLSHPHPSRTLPALIPTLLPPLLRPLIPPDAPFTEPETALLPPELQYLTAVEQPGRERDARVLKAVVEALWLLVVRGGEGGRRGVRDGGAYAVLRELHLGLDEEEEEEGVREAVERCVDVLMAEDEGDGGMLVGEKEGEGDSEDEKVVEVF